MVQDVSDIELFKVLLFCKDNKMKDLGRICGFRDKQGALVLLSIGLWALIISVDYAAYSFLFLFLRTLHCWLCFSKEVLFDWGRHSSQAARIYLPFSQWILWATNIWARQLLLRWRAERWMKGSFCSRKFMFVEKVCVTWKAHTQLKTIENYKLWLPNSQ